MHPVLQRNQRDTGKPKPGLGVKQRRQDAGGEFRGFLRHRRVLSNSSVCSGIGRIASRQGRTRSSLKTDNARRLYRRDAAGFARCFGIVASRLQLRATAPGVFPKPACATLRCRPVRVLEETSVGFYLRSDLDDFGEGRKYCFSRGSTPGNLTRSARNHRKCGRSTTVRNHAPGSAGIGGLGKLTRRMPAVKRDLREIRRFSGGA